jgi:hypothetical protein
MTERERMKPESVPEQDPRDERLRSLLKAAYPASELPEALEQSVAELAARQSARATRRGAWWPLPMGWGLAAGAVAATLVVVLGVVLARWSDHRGGRNAAPAVVSHPHPPGSIPETWPVTPTPQPERSPRVAERRLVQSGIVDAIIPPSGTPFHQGAGQAGQNSSGAPPRRHPNAGTRRREPVSADDLAFVNQAPETVAHQWTAAPQAEWDQIEAQVRRTVHVKDDFVQIPFPRIAATSGRSITQAVESYRREAAVVDPRLSRQVTLQAKGMALSDLCDDLRAQTGIQLVAGRSVADEKVTIFCEKLPLRQVMRELNRLFGFTWLRSGKPGEYRYELEQDLKSQLLEEELRNRDFSAAVLAMDAQMQKYQPYLNKSLEEFIKGARQPGEMAEPMSYVVRSSSWGGMQLYHRLTPADRAVLTSGEELVFRPDAPNPDRRLPAEWNRPILQSLQGKEEINGKLTPIPEVPGIRLTQVRLQLRRSELGEVSLVVRVSAAWKDQSREGQQSSVINPGLATGRSPSVAKPENAKANASLRGQPPFDQTVSLKPEASCPAPKNPRRAGNYSGNYDRVFDLQEPHALSADVWEAVHRATGLPVVADFYTRLYPMSKVTPPRQSLFESLCAVGDSLGVRWRKDDDFLLCRSTSYFWDRLKEVPNRYLQRWVKSRDANGSLPFADFLEMAAMSDQQLDSGPGGEGIEHFWGLREWAWLGGAWLEPPPTRGYARFLAILTPDQQRRAREPEGMAFRDLTRLQQQAFIQLQYEQLKAEERLFNEPRIIQPDEFANGVIRANYIPAGWYMALVPPSSVKEGPYSGPVFIVGGRTAEEATAAARRLHPNSAPPELRLARDGYFNTDFQYDSR